jgi:hypothetical protein
MHTTRASGPMLSPSPTHGLGLKSKKMGSLIKFTTAGETETPSARQAKQAGVEMEETKQPDPPMPTSSTTTSATATTSSSSGSDSIYRTDSVSGPVSESQHIAVSEPNSGDGAGTADMAERERRLEKIAEKKGNLQNEREESAEKEKEKRQASTRYVSPATLTRTEPKSRVRGRLSLKVAEHRTLCGREGNAVAAVAAAVAAAADADAAAATAGVAAAATAAGNAMSGPTWKSFELSLISDDECSLHVESGHDKPTAKQAESSSDSDETSSSSDDSDDETPAAKPATPATTPADPESNKPTRKATWTKAQSDMLNHALKVRSRERESTRVRFWSVSASGALAR